MSTSAKTLVCQAAVAWEPNKPLSIEIVEVAPPRRGEVRVKIMSTSVCHSDATVLAGLPICRFQLKFPVILGHEAAGIVESVGDGVDSFDIGDVVVPVSVSQCFQCCYCKYPDTNLCSAIAESQCSGLMPDFTSRFTCKGKQIFHFMDCSTFSQYTVVPEVALCKINPEMPLDAAGLLGCGFTTGYGSVVQVAKVPKGSVCAVWGLGAVGLSAVIGCKRLGAGRIIAIDPNTSKFNLALKLGATECIDPSSCSDIVECIDRTTNGMGCDFTFECVGTCETIRQAFTSCNKAYGECVINGVLPSFQEVSIDPFLLLSGRRLRGAILGGYKLREAIPKLVEEFLAGLLPLNDLITHRVDFSDINIAFKLLHEGSVRTVINFSE